MDTPEWCKFIDAVLKHVKFKYDHLDIKKEIYEHMEDMYEDLLLEGMDEETAITAVVEHMGNSDEIGIALNKEHKPFLGWVWRISRIVTILLIFICLIPAFNFGMITLFSVFSSYHDKTDSEMIYKVEINDRAKIDNTYIFIDEIRYYKNSELELRYATFENPFSDSVKWSFSLSGFYDEDGNLYRNGSGSSSAGYYSRHQVFLRDFPKDAEKFIIDYDEKGRNLRFEISLPEVKEGI